MPVPPSSRIATCLVDLVDPRMARTGCHELLDLVSLALCAVLASADSWLEVEEWGTINLA
jgi:DDE_Tnp_1-associated